MTFSEFYVGIVVKLKGIKIWVPHCTRGGVEYRADSLEQRGFVDGRTTAHNAAISPLLLAPLSKLALRISEL